MYNGQTVSLKEILWKTLNHPLATDLTYEIAAENAIECLRLIGAPLLFENKVTDPGLIVENHKCLLPSNLLELRGIRLIQNDAYPERSAIALRHATDLYHDSKNKNTLDEFTYNIQNGVIFTSFPDGCIEVSYKAISCDKDGFPLIPDNVKVKLAIRYYILYEFLAPLADIGKITEKAFDRIEKNSNWYMGAAQTSMQLQNMDHLESAMNAINRIIVNTDLHKQFYKGAGEKERFKRYN